MQLKNSAAKPYEEFSNTFWQFLRALLWTNFLTPSGKFQWLRSMTNLANIHFCELCEISENVFSYLSSGGCFCISLVPWIPSVLIYLRANVKSESRLNIVQISRLLFLIYLWIRYYSYENEFSVQLDLVD